MLSQTSSESLALMIVIGAGLAAAVIDVNTRRVPNPLTGGVALAGLLLALSGVGHIGIGAAFAGCAIGLALMLPGHIFGATGGGDVKLLAALGTLMGPWTTITAFVITAIAGGVIALGVAMQRRRLGKTLGATVRLATGSQAAVEEIEADRTFAYAPAIAIGAALAAIGV
jgi:prepilin peptidase CpaA